MIRLAGRLVFALACTALILQATGLALEVSVEDESCRDEPFGCLPLSCPTCVGCAHSLPIAIVPVIAVGIDEAPPACRFDRTDEDRPESADPREILHVPRATSAS
jgi:hypothetical protein